jgi:aminoglycoside phosphotransferase family enzyme
MILNTRKQQQSKLVLALKNKNAYPHEVYLSKIKIYETHISWIFLTGLYAYKIKKEVKFGKILDFSTLYLRRKFCRKEIQVNKVLCADMYKGIVKLISRDNGIKIVDLQTKGKPLEYGVKMLEIPQKFRMDYLIKADKVSLKTIDRLIRILVKFHSSTRTNTTINSYGLPNFQKKKIDENFQTFGKLNNEIVVFKLDKIHKIYKRLISFLANNKTLFYKRIRQRKIREIHGDLYLGNIFVVNDKRFYLYDRIEFNDSLRYADVTEDVAHLSMDLDYKRRIDLRKYFVSQYIKRSDDVDLRNLLYFLMCYKACVRAKVSLFRAKNETDNQTRKRWIEESKNLLELAASYIESL